MSRPSSRPPRTVCATWPRTPHRGYEDIGEPVAATDPEDDTLTYSLDVSIAAATLSSIDASTTGQLQTKAALDYETGTHTYTVTVTATDPVGLDDTIEVTITVNNVDEPGTVTLSSTAAHRGNAIELTAVLDDPDGVSGSVTWSWARSPNGSSFWTPISGATSAAYTPVAADVTRLPAGHRLLHRWRRVGQERTGGLGQ